MIFTVVWTDLALNSLRYGWLRKIALEFLLLRIRLTIGCDTIPVQKASRAKGTSAF